MSHFAVLVVLPEKPTKDVLDRTLAPWHEFSGSGYDEDYVVETDITQEALDLAARETETRVRDGDGVLHDPYDSEGELKLQFSKMDEERDRRFFHVPEGFEEIKISLAEAGVDLAEWIAEYHGAGILRMGETPDRCGDHKHGWVAINDAREVVSVTKRTNPNGKWDYWTLGGRYAGRLKPGYDPEKDPENQERCFLCYGSGKRCDEIGNDQRVKDPSYTCNGCRGTGMTAKWPSKWKDVGNTARWGDLDIPALKVSSVESRREFVENMRIESGLSPEDFETGHLARKAGHQVWLELPEPRPRGADYSQWLRGTQPYGELAAKVRIADTWNDIDTPDGMSIADWIETAPPLSAYAVVINGKWCARGEVGWFGISLGEDDGWPVQFESILASIPEDHHVAFVDCHV